MDRGPGGRPPQARLVALLLPARAHRVERGVREADAPLPVGDRVRGHPSQGQGVLGQRGDPGVGRGPG